MNRQNEEIKLKIAEHQEERQCIELEREREKVRET